MALSTLAGLLLAGLTAPAAAEEAPAIAVVQGVSAGDLLNLRATASPVGKVETRLPNGASLNKFACESFDGYDWCEVQDIDNPQMRGWVPARYLRDAAPGEVAAASAILATGATERVEVGPSGNGAAGTGPANPGDVPIEVPPDLAARFGDTDPDAAEQKSATVVQKAMQDAYGTSAADTSASDTAEATPPPGVEESDDAAGETAAVDIPLPTPRPDGAGTDAPAPDAPTVMAQAEQPAAAPVAPPALAPAGEIPCARYVGQPMTRCTVSVTHIRADAADVTVTWPDGGTRTISFRDGKASGANSRGAFRVTREGALNMIRVGLSERFEITDAVPFED